MIKFWNEIVETLELVIYLIKSESFMQELIEF